MKNLLKALYQRQQSFYWQIASQYIALSIFISFVFFFGLVAVAWNYLDAAEQQLEWGVAENIAAELKDELAKAPLDPTEIQKRFYQFSQQKPGTEYYLLDSRGRVLVSNYPYLRQVRPEPLLRFLAAKTQPLRPIYGDNPRRDQPKTSIFSVAPVRLEASSGTNSFGYLYVILRGQEWYAVYGMLGNFSAIALGVLAMLLCLFLGAVLGLRIVSSTTRRFEKMTSAIRKFSAGQYSSRINDRGSDELAQHAQAFDSMADTITTTMDELERIEGVRQELMSHITHDLRAPISVMRTTLESQLLDFDKLDEAARKKLVTQALSNCLALNQLISQMLEINRLAQGKQALQLDTFSFAELAADVTLSVEPAAEQKNIALKGEFESAKEFVRGDIALLERVLRNLLENAIRYSRPGSIVNVRCKNLPNAVMLEVEDHGVGIPAAELPLIFDRFYRASNAKAHSAEGTGLGLSIVAKILESHGSKLQVSSREGQGSVFSFSLPTVPAAA